MMEGVRLTPLKQIKVPKGDLWHAFKSIDEGFVGFGEAYFTQIKPGEVKGWKRHNEYQLNLVVVSGKVKFVIHNEGSGEFEEVVLSPEENYQRLTIAPGLWMAFAGMDDNKNSMLIDLIPGLHNPEEADKAELCVFPYVFFE